MENKETGKFIIILPVFISSEVYFADTLDEVKGKIENLTENEQEIDEVGVFEWNKEINVKSLFDNRAGRGIKINVTDEFHEKLNFKNCLCCGQPTLKTEIHDICSICWWQDDPAAWNDANFEGGANGISLKEARINYEKFGDCDGLDGQIDEDKFPDGINKKKKQLDE